MDSRQVACRMLPTGDVHELSRFSAKDTLVRSQGTPPLFGEGATGYDAPDSSGIHRHLLRWLH
jgi:hypothetical protein